MTSKPGIGRLLCWLGYHDMEWDEYGVAFRAGHCRRCKGWNYQSVAGR